MAVATTPPPPPLSPSIAACMHPNYVYCCCHRLLFLCHAGGYDADLVAALTSGQVGAPVQPGDAPLLRLRPLRQYAAGELVAVRRIAAGANNDVDGGGGSNSGSNTGPLCYARVAADSAPPSGQPAYRLFLEVEPGVYQNLLSTQVC